MMLAGDIGGTHSRLALTDLKDGRPGFAAQDNVLSREHQSLEEIVRQFLARHGVRVERACLAVAGPVVGGRVQATNLPWIIDSARLSRELGIGQVEIINDLEANAYGIAYLEGGDLLTLQAGSPAAKGNIAVISAGTGLGEAGIYWDGAKHHPFACEGGHADFAPSSEIEIGLLRYLMTRFERVSWERVLSGPGLQNIYQFLRDTGGGEESEWLRRELEKPGAPAAISAAALERKSPLAEQALDLFCTLYGAEAGNLALKIMATGGVFVGGGIAPKIIEKLKTSGFLAAFAAKGRLHSLLEKIPVKIVLNDRAALIGAAHRALIGASAP